MRPAVRRGAYAFRPTLGAWSLALTCLTAAAAGAPADAQQQESLPRSWLSLAVPGGTNGLLAAAGLETTRPRATALLDVIHVIHDLAPGVDPEVDERRARVIAYLDALEALHRARASFADDPVRLAPDGRASSKERFDSLAVALGSTLVARSGSYALELGAAESDRQRRAWLAVAGLDADAVVDRLNHGEAADLSVRSDSVPLPLPDGAWRRLTGATGHQSWNLVRAILADHQASLLYYGLCSMDEETRGYLAIHPALLERLYAPDRAPLVPLFGRSLHVRAGRIDTPGGPAAVPLWEAIAGEPVAEPDAFILAVLGKDGGRLASLYDAVGHMDEARQRFALGLWIDGADRRVDRFKALYAACAAGLSRWHPHVRPFARGLYDPAHLLLVVRVSPDGRPGPLGWKSFWQRALADQRLPARPAEETADVEQGGVLDAAALLETIYGDRASFRRDIAEAWCFGERVFGAATRNSLPDILVAIRGFRRYRSLVLTLERLGIVNPGVYAAALGRAERIAGIGDEDRATTALSLYQGALVLVERTRLGRTIDASTASSLVDSLARLPISAGGDDLGSVASWIDTRFLPALGMPTALDADAAPAAEVRILAAFAGRRGGSLPTRPTVDYEGTRYQVDPSGAELARIEAVREKQRGISLDAALTFVREVRKLAEGVNSPEEIRARLARLDQAAAPLLSSPWRATPEWEGGTRLRATVTQASRDLDVIRKGGDHRTVETHVASLTRAADRQLGQVLASLAYASVLADPNSIALMAGDPSLVHDWGLRDSNESTHTAWRLPSDSRDNGGRWHVRGSLLALDLCLGIQGLHRLSTDALPGPPTISEDDRRGFTEAAVLSNALDYRDEDMALLGTAIRCGRERVAALASNPAQLADVTLAAGLDEERQALLSWAVVDEPDRVARFFSVGELLRLGGQGERNFAALDAWGTSGLSYDGRLSLRFPLSQPLATLAGRRTRGVVAALVPDLALLVAETLDERRLPAVLTRSVLMVATLDCLDRVALGYDDDWMTLVADIQRIVTSRIDDYLASVTTAGPLVPLGRATEDKGR